jgi:hypothetical protein
MGGREGRDGAMAHGIQSLRSAQLSTARPLPGSVGSNRSLVRLGKLRGMEKFELREPLA